MQPIPTNIRTYLEVLAFPANDFGQLELGENEEISGTSDSSRSLSLTQD